MRLQGIAVIRQRSTADRRPFGSQKRRPGRSIREDWDNRSFQFDEKRRLTPQSLNPADYADHRLAAENVSPELRRLVLHLGQWLR